jgi:hypothetical protein
MRFPLADEIESARQRAAEAGRAGVDLARAESAVVALDVLAHQLRHRPDALPESLPGASLVDEVAEHWPALCDLGASNPRAGDPPEQRVQARRSQLEAVRLALRPLARAAEAHALALHELQHRQRHALEAPAWAAAAQALATLRARRDDVAHRLAPVEHRLAVVRPVRAVLEPFTRRIAEALAQRPTPDPTGALAWRTAHLARAVVESVQQVLAPVRLELPVPPPPAIPIRPPADPQVADALWWDIEGVQERLVELATALSAEADRLTEEHGSLSGDLAALDAQIHEQTG